MPDYNEDFPFAEIRDNGGEDGDYFHGLDDALQMVKKLNLPEGEKHIWSVVHGDDDGNISSMSYGPSHHWVNLAGYTITREAHDGETYYHETWERDDDDEIDLDVATSGDNNGIDVDWEPPFIIKP